MKKKNDPAKKSVDPKRRGVRRRLGIIASLCLMVFSGVAEAIPISINNPGFEAVVLPDGADVSDVPGWTTTFNSQGTWNVSTRHFHGEAPEGQSVAYNNSGDLFQVLSAVLHPETTYTLQVDVGQFVGPVDYAIELWADDQLLVREISSPATLGVFNTSTLTYDSLSGDPGLGSPLRINLHAFGASTQFDNVRLDATSDLDPAPVPEPSTLILIGSGLTGMIAFGKRRSRSVLEIETGEEIPTLPIHRGSHWMGLCRIEKSKWKG